MTRAQKQHATEALFQKPKTAKVTSQQMHKRNQRFLWKRHSWTACQYRRWPGRAESGPAAPRTGGLLNRWTLMCLRGSVSCQVMLECNETSSACWRWFGLLSRYNAASCSRIKGIGDLIHSSHLNPTWLWAKVARIFSHVLSLLLNVNIWIVLNTFSSTWDSDLCDYSSRVSYFNQINADPLSLKNPRNCMF